mmetsp:Transcript_33818/g.77285  ORF Transcript_33818/g.77285 Transcript_33818/m.77285 type:complete len:240 (-) Transcript_33818:2170-2889(-)
MTILHKGKLEEDRLAPSNSVQQKVDNLVPRRVWRLAREGSDGRTPKLSRTVGLRDGNGDGRALEPEMHQLHLERPRAVVRPHGGRARQRLGAGPQLSVELLPDVPLGGLKTRVWRSRFAGVLEFTLVRVQFSGSTLRCVNIEFEIAAPITRVHEESELGMSIHDLLACRVDARRFVISEARQGELERGSLDVGPEHFLLVSHSQALHLKVEQEWSKVHLHVVVQLPRAFGIENERASFP